MLNSKTLNSSVLFVKLLAKELQKDHTFTSAAALAYYLLLATFPALVALIGILPYIPVEGLDEFIRKTITSELPGGAGTAIQETLTQVLTQKKPTLASIGFLGALWASTSGMAAVVEQLNVAYGVAEKYSFLQLRVKAFGLTFIYGFLVLISSVLIVGSGLTDLEGFQARVLLEGLRFALAFAVLMLALAALYHFGPRGTRKFKYVTPGSFAGALLLMLATLGLDIYISNFSNYDKTYGSLGGIIVYMLWLYVAGLIILLGAEINDVLKKRDSSHEKIGGKTV